MKKYWFFTLILTLMLIIGCSIDDESNEITQIETSELSLLEILADDDLITAKRPQPSVYADCDKFTGLVVPALFKPTSGKFDELYGGVVFKDGFPLISDSKPGDQDYNGGRWHMNMYIGDSPDAYANACSEEDIMAISWENGWNMNDFESTDMYFGCPLKKAKN